LAKCGGKSTAYLPQICCMSIALASCRELATAHRLAAQKRIQRLFPAAARPGKRSGKGNGKETANKTT
jgi:hypothetical protein